MDKKRLNRIFLLSTAGVLLLLGVLGAVRAMRPEVNTGPVIVEQEQVDTVQLETLELSPSPTPEPKPASNCLPGSTVLVAPSGETDIVVELCWKA